MKKILGILFVLAGCVGARAAQVYVANGNAGTVVVFDTATNAVVGAPIVVGVAPDGVAMAPNGAFVYVVNSGNSTVSVVDTTKKVEVANISVGMMPHDIAVNPAGTYAYAAGVNVTVIDLATYAPTVYPVPNPPPGGVAVAPNGTAYVATAGSVLPVTPAGVGTAIPVVGSSNNLSGIVLSPDGAVTYVADSTNHKVFVVPLDGSAQTAISVGTAPIGVAKTPNGAYVYVTNSGSNTVSIIQTSDDTVTTVTDLTPATFNVPRGIVIDAAGAYAYVTNFTGNTVSRINLATNKVIDTVTDSSALLSGPLGIAMQQRLSPVGEKTSDVFFDQIDNINLISWTAPASGAMPVTYQIYRDADWTVLAGTVPGTATKPLVADHNRKPGDTYSYYIVAEYTGGVRSLYGMVTV